LVDVGKGRGMNEWDAGSRMQVQRQVYQNAAKSFKKAGFWRLQKGGSKEWSKGPGVFFSHQ
jgi:hypothetical protein